MAHQYIAVVELQSAKLLFAGHVLVATPLHFGHEVDLKIINRQQYLPVLAIRHITRMPGGPQTACLFSFPSSERQMEAGFMEDIQNTPHFNTGLIKTVWDLVGDWKIDGWVQCKDRNKPGGR